MIANVLTIASDSLHGESSLAAIGSLFTRFTVVHSSPDEHEERSMRACTYACACMCMYAHVELRVAAVRVPCVTAVM